MNSTRVVGRPVEILMVEDDKEDVLLTQEALKDAKMSNILHVVNNGDEAMEYLQRRGQFSQAERPDLIIMDLNLPGMNGKEILGEIKKDSQLSTIPVVILTTSDANKEISECYRLRANCFIHKPVDLDQFLHVIKSIEDFWLTIVKLPPQ